MGVSGRRRPRRRCSCRRRPRREVLMRPRFLVARASVALAVLAGPSCGHGPGEDILDDVSLRDFRSCGELEDHIKGQALREMNATIDQLIENDNYPGRGFFP